MDNLNVCDRYVYDLYNDQAQYSSLFSTTYDLHVSIINEAIQLP